MTDFTRPPNRRQMLLGGLILYAGSWSGVEASDRFAGHLLADQVRELCLAAIERGELPGVVVVIGHRGRVLFKEAFGARSVRPRWEAMTTDTLFDLASLTKVVCTTSCVMALVEDGRLRLSDRAAQHWPEFGAAGKDRVTIRQLLTHTSGLPAWENFQRRFSLSEQAEPQDARAQVLGAVAERALSYETDTRVTYSDLGFIALGHIVERISGESLNRFAERRIFHPLGMRETLFRPSGDWVARSAPTTERGGRFLRGQVHDENASVLNGVAGHAGLFSTAGDLVRFCGLLLSGDPTHRRRPALSPATVRLMTTPQTPAGLPVRGLGWDIASGYAHVRGDLMPLGSIGHTGFTGTFLWVDPRSGTFVVGLSNRLHPDGRGNPLRLWAMLSNTAARLIPASALPPRD